MIVIALGANLESPRCGSPVKTLTAALEELGRRGVGVVRRSRWVKTAPVPLTCQPWFVNAVAQVETGLSPQALLTLLHEVEDAFGRIREERWGPRVIDLDLVAYGDYVSDPREHLQLPHPRLQDRKFVLLPLQDILPGWRHPVTGCSIPQMLARIDGDQETAEFEVPSSSVGSCRCAVHGHSSEGGAVS